MALSEPIVVAKVWFGALPFTVLRQKLPLNVGLIIGHSDPKENLLHLGNLVSALALGDALELAGKHRGSPLSLTVAFGDSDVRVVAESCPTCGACSGRTLVRIIFQYGSAKNPVQKYYGGEPEQAYVLGRAIRNTAKGLWQTSTTSL